MVGPDRLYQELILDYIVPHFIMCMYFVLYKYVVTVFVLCVYLYVCTGLH